MATVSRIALLLLSLALLLGCESKEGKELKKRPASRESSAKLALPPGGTWSSAVMVTESGSFERAYGGRGGIGSATYYFARTFLVLARSGGGEDRVFLTTGSLEGTDARAALEATDRKWRLAAPSDGRGVAFAPEGVEEWRWVCCDASAPFACPHLVLDPRDGDPCAAAPRWKDFALQLMLPPEPGSAHPEGPDGNEWPQLVALVARDWGDAKLLKAVADAALRERSGLVLSGIERQTISRLQGAVAFDLYPSSGEPWPTGISRTIRADARTRLKRPASAGSIVASNAAVLLGWSNAEEDQRAMAAALLSQDWAPVATVARDTQWPRALAWSLASSTGRLFSDFPEDVQSSMLEFLHREIAKPETSLPLVFALAEWGSRESRRKLAEMSAPDVDGGTQGKPDPAWPATLDELWQVGVVDHGALTHPLDAWIRAGLRSRK